MHVLVVGCGLSGAATARFLANNSIAAGLAGLTISIWDKARGMGGRMSTHRAPELKGEPCVDMGAQYVTKGINPNCPPVESVYTDLLSAGVLRPFEGTIEGEPPPPRGTTPSTTSLIAPAGTSSIVRYLAAKSNASVVFSRRVTTITADRGSWMVGVEGGDAPERFDAVVLTLPAPQVLRDLGGDVPALIEEVRPQLENVQYSSRYAVAAYYPEECDAAVQSLPWAVKYVNDDPCLRYVSVETRKRGLSGVCPGLLLHSSVPYGIANVDGSAEKAQADMLSALPKYIPGLQGVEPILTKVTRWRYSQVRHPLEGAPRALQLGGGRWPPLVLTGDALTGSNFDGCIAGGAKAAELVVAALMKQKEPQLSR